MKGHDELTRQASDNAEAATRPLCHHLARELLQAIEEPEETPAPLLAEALLRDALRSRATDLHLDTQSQGVLVRMRIDGMVHDAALLDQTWGGKLGNQLKNLARLSPVTRFVAEDARISHEIDGKTLDIRLTRAPCLHGDKLSVRLFEIPAVPYHLHDLGLHARGLEAIQEWLSHVSGMLLVAGPAGSGKTTTLYALLPSGV